MIVRGMSGCADRGLAEGEAGEAGEQEERCFLLGALMLQQLEASTLLAANHL